MNIRLPDFLEGAVDMHVHSSPDIDERKFDDISLARAAVQGGWERL
jgi:dihydroorotase-like cyclic amidohydrolase